MTPISASTLTNPRLYVAYWLQSRAQTVSPVGDVIIGDTPALLVRDTAWLDYGELCRAWNASNPNQKVNLFSHPDFAAAFGESLTSYSAAARSHVIASLRHDPTSSDDVGSFTRALVGTHCSLTAAVLRHWLWSIKRKAFGKPVHDHIMPILFGAQGAGKTVAVDMLCRPLSFLAMNSTLRDVTDERTTASLEQHLVLIFDELQGASRSDMDVLKNRITACFVSYRPMKTNQVVKVAQRSSFIGTTNRPVSEQIYDPTGMRRFYEIKTQDKLDWDLLNALDYPAMWRSIDENRDEGYIAAHLPALREAQQTFTAVDPLDAFIEEKNLKVFAEESEQTKTVQNSTLYDAYVAWCASNGIKSVLTSITFGLRLTARGWPAAHVKRYGHATARVRYMSIDSDITCDADSKHALWSAK